MLLLLLLLPLPPRLLALLREPCMCGPGRRVGGRLGRQYKGGGPSLSHKTSTLTYVPTNPHSAHACPCPLHHPLLLHHHICNPRRAHARTQEGWPLSSSPGLPEKLLWKSAAAVGFFLLR